MHVSPYVRHSRAGRSEVPIRKPRTCKRANRFHRHAKPADALQLAVNKLREGGSHTARQALVSAVNYMKDRHFPDCSMRDRLDKLISRFDALEGVVELERLHCLLAQVQEEQLIQGVH